MLIIYGLPYIAINFPFLLDSCHKHLPSEWRKYGKRSQDVRSCRYQRNKTLCTGTGSEYSKGYAESE